MTLRVISVGVGRTGTFTMKTALEQLGLGRCHHMEEVDATSPRDVGLWMAAAQGKADWSVNYSGFSAAADWPTAAFSRELFAAFPNAKFILTVRETESWYKSFSETIYPLIEAEPKTPEEMRPFLRMVSAVVHKTGFRIPSSKEEIIAAYERHNRSVQELIPASSLLVFNVRQGWEPLCRYLGVNVPDTEFPKTNNTQAFWDSVQSVKA